MVATRVTATLTQRTSTWLVACQGQIFCPTHNDLSITNKSVGMGATLDVFCARASQQKEARANEGLYWHPNPPHHSHHDAIEHLNWIGTTNHRCPRHLASLRCVWRNERKFPHWRSTRRRLKMITPCQKVRAIVYYMYNGAHRLLRN